MSDLNNDKKLTEVEVMANPNRAIVWKWSQELEEYPAMSNDLIEGMDIPKYLSYYNTNIPESTSVGSVTNTTTTGDNGNTPTKTSGLFTTIIDTTVEGRTSTDMTT